MPDAEAHPRVFATWNDDPAQHEPFLICQECGETLCSVEEGDEFVVLARVVTEHQAERHPPEMDPNENAEPRTRWTYAEALQLVRDFNENATDNPEYLRGQLELMADLYPVVGMACGDRARQIGAELWEASARTAYRAIFTPEAWMHDVAAEVDTEGPNEWDVTEQVLADPDYWQQMVSEEIAMGDPSTDYAWKRGVLDRDDHLKNDANAPEWVREWRGPFTLRVYTR